jgi:hypothetical protein
VRDHRAANSRIITNTLAGFARQKNVRAGLIGVADRFAANYHHAGDAALPYRAHDQMERMRKV